MGQAFRHTLFSHEMIDITATVINMSKWNNFFFIVILNILLNVLYIYIETKIPRQARIAKEHKTTFNSTDKEGKKRRINKSICKS